MSGHFKLGGLFDGHDVSLKEVVNCLTVRSNVPFNYSYLTDHIGRLSGWTEEIPESLGLNRFSKLDMRRLPQLERNSLSKAKQSKAKQSKAKQSKAKQGKAELNVLDSGTTL